MHLHGRATSLEKMVLFFLDPCPVTPIQSRDLCTPLEESEQHFESSLLKEKLMSLFEVPCEVQAPYPLPLPQCPAPSTEAPCCSAAVTFCLVSVSTSLRSLLYAGIFPFAPDSPRKLVHTGLCIPTVSTSKPPLPSWCTMGWEVRLSSFYSH